MLVRRPSIERAISAGALTGGGGGRTGVGVEKLFFGPYIGAQSAQQYIRRILVHCCIDFL
jgi:hypothetical protein